jgi:hypothetical protein
MRNSFGKRWGFYGDFSIPLRSFDAEQIHSISYIDPNDVEVTQNEVN